jgi:hypothetical protein
MAITDIIMAATGNTTVSSKPAAGAAAPSYAGAAVIGLALAVVCGGLAAPRLAAAVAAAGAGDTLWAVHGGRTVATDDLAAGAANLAAARRWVVNGETEADRGLLLLRLAMAAEPGAERQLLLEEAEAATIAGLTAAPGQPGAWARLAWLRDRRGDAGGAAAALRLSWLSGSVAPEMMASRLDLGLRLAPAMDSETMSLLYRQIRLTWVTTPDVVARLAALTEVGAIVQAALADLSESDVAGYLLRHGRATAP